jgi:hypothetical protein
MASSEFGDVMDGIVTHVDDDCKDIRRAIPPMNARSDSDLGARQRHPKAKPNRASIGGNRAANS